jgi:CubicO group peptidase (beta-lactamase class C family)
MERMINSSYNNIGGIIVQKGGKIQYENYYNGCTATSRFHVFSVTKSIISILLGIALDQGYIKSIDQRVLDFFPEYEVKRGEQTIQRITLRDMLTMTAPYKYKTEPYTEYFASNDWVKSALDLLGGKGKIGEFRYAPLIGPDIFSGILIKGTGLFVLDFATENLFAPLGIRVEGKVVFHNKEEQLAWYQEKNVKGWVADPRGVNTAGWGLTLTAVDMAKLGQLYMDGGSYQNQQIVSTQWINESIMGHSHWDKLSYGYLWWIIDDKEPIYAAMGDGWNVIYVNEKRKLVISIASYFVPQAKDRLKLIRGYIEPVFS